ncbi:uncharacterized protein [Oryza sativa Japonica Group]|uniref:holo-[acyl-carrier-protein] synthase n=3 Tax=Oryza TaxID=4527 RepID=B9FZT3_ORYSJ|nr:uncharacterized protein LOC4345046 [Oryza sativa Japonica Group]KAB8107901.1 hypothetical protein EE612_043031 [Oryza sativa]EEE68300.1 hypothetical protein OsJ_26560 [Oryza sativa Japonica Group]KAF2918776.1 hypothetical protein DAI22_08g081800 [Oryza sativa Japonica Group]BAD05634.1 putative MtaA [Oryza sativa Japonica Group]BAF23259.1 Os08g0243100 [Oryza sativa Japonica Group]|eukprot:NP_001061345.1 Os08g0243100 [Oryza sativa Japonica Group]
MHHRLLLRRGAMPVPPPLPPRTPPPGVARPFASLPPPPPLQSRREVHVWYVCPDELNDHSHLDMYMELLSPSERKNALSMNGPRLQKDAMLSRALLRTTLSRYTNSKIDPRSFEFKKNKFGKPEILWRSDDSNMEWPWHFNISHTSSLIACGIAMDAPIGIDVEEKKRKTTKSILSLARRYFTPSEVDSLAKIADSDAQQKEFIKLWTLKEAYVKALGRGFSGAPFNRFSIQLKTNSRIQITKAPKVCNDSDSGDYLSENWRFALTELNSSYYMAVCIEDNSRGSENGSVPLGLKVWKTVPFIEDTLVSGTDAVKLIT